jgi:hypothetical protein
MSNLVQINEYLDQTRNLSVDELNALIRAKDQSAEPQVSQGFAHAILGYMQQIEINGEVATFEAAKAKADKLKGRHGWLFVEPTEEQEKPVAIEAPATVKQPKVAVEKKSEIAKRIFEGLADKSKANVIEVFQRELNTSPAGAQTFYYACGGEKSGKRGRKPSATASAKPVYVRKTDPATPSKRDQAAKLFAVATDKSRAVITARFQQELGLSPACATTYFYSVGGARVRAGK